MNTENQNVDKVLSLRSSARSSRFQDQNLNIQKQKTIEKSLIDQEITQQTDNQSTSGLAIPNVESHNNRDTSFASNQSRLQRMEQFTKELMNSQHKKRSRSNTPLAAGGRVSQDFSNKSHSRLLNIGCNESSIVIEDPNNQSNCTPNAIIRIDGGYTPNDVTSNNHLNQSNTPMDNNLTNLMQSNQDESSVLNISTSNILQIEAINPLKALEKNFTQTFAQKNLIPEVITVQKTGANAAQSQRNHTFGSTKDMHEAIERAKSEEDFQITQSPMTIIQSINSINGCQTQRNEVKAVNNEEFEKRLTDIKEKLALIKNSISSDMDESFTFSVNDTNDQYNSNFQTRNTNSNIKIDSEEKESVQMSQTNAQLPPRSYPLSPSAQSEVDESNQQTSYNQNYSDQQQQIKENICINNRLRVDNIESKIIVTNKQDQSKVFTYNSQKQLLKEQDDELLSHYESLSSHNSQKHNLPLKSNYSSINTNAPLRIDLNSSQRYFMLKSLIENSYHQVKSTTNQSLTSEPKPHNFTLKNADQQPTMNTHSSINSNHQDISRTQSLLKENDHLKQKVALLMIQEQQLNSKIDYILGQRDQEKQRYEEQIKKMEQEIVKMCDLMQEKIRKRTCKGEGKRKKVSELEKQVKDLRSQLKQSQEHSAKMSSTLQNLTQWQHFQILAQDTQSKHFIGSCDERLMRIGSLTYAHDQTLKMKPEDTCKNEDKEEKLQQQFEAFKQEMYHKQLQQEQAQEKLVEDLESQFRQELDRRSTELDSLRQENYSLRHLLKQQQTSESTNSLRGRQRSSSRKRSTKASPSTNTNPPTKSDQKVASNFSSQTQNFNSEQNTEFNSSLKGMRKRRKESQNNQGQKQSQKSQKNDNINKEVIKKTKSKEKIINRNKSMRMI